MNRSLAISAALSGLILAAGCSLTPSVTKEKMTLGEAHIEKMECRTETPIGTVFARTVCAAPQAWAQADAAAKYESDLAFEQARSVTNAGAFNRR